MDNILWASATALLAWVARVKARLGIQPKGARFIFWVCILTIIFIFLNENIAYALNIIAIIFAFMLGRAERKFIKEKEDSKNKPSS